MIFYFIAIKFCNSHLEDVHFVDCLNYKVLIHCSFNLNECVSLYLSLLYTFRYKITSSMLGPYVIDEGSLPELSLWSLHPYQFLKISAHGPYTRDPRLVLMGRTS